VLSIHHLTLHVNEKFKEKQRIFAVHIIKPWGVEVRLHSFLISELDGGEQPAAGLRGRIAVQH
jgi:hypothetical protein